jgi:hypothetical protein
MAKASRSSGHSSTEHSCAAAVERCPICEHGRVLVAIEDGSQTLFLACDECGAEWDAPGNLSASALRHGQHSFSRLVLHPELDGHPWSRYLRPTTP